LTFECGDSCISRPLTKYDSAIAKEIAEIWPDLKSRSQNKLDKVKKVVAAALMGPKAMAPWDPRPPN